MKKLLGLCCLCSLQSFAQTAEVADLVMWNGTIYTANAKQEVVEALAIKDDRIIYAGDRAGIESLVATDTEVLDLAGRMALPGLHDVHIHPVEAIEKTTCELPGQNEFDLERVVLEVKKCLQKLGKGAPAPGGWITVTQFNGYGADSPSYRGRFSSVREGLDSISKEHKIFLLGADAHVYGVNSYSLEHAAALNGEQIAVNARTLSGKLAAYSAYFQVDSRGEPAGIVKDAGAYDLFDYEKESVESLVARSAEINRYFHKAGITSAQAAWSPPREVDVFEGMAKGGSLQIRMTMNLKVSRDQYIDESGLLRKAAMLKDFKEVRERFTQYDRLRADGVKLMVDGVIEHPAQTALMKQHYLQATWGDDGAIQYSVDREACPESASPCSGELFNYGILEYKKQDLADTTVALDKAGFTIHFHALGDEAINITLSAIEAAREANPESKLPHNIAHLQQVDPTDIPRFGAAGVYITPTMSWLSPWHEYDKSVIPYIDEHKNVDVLEDLYDQDTGYMQKLYTIASIQKAGGIVSAGSDAPVDGPLPRPFSDIMYGVLRGGLIERPESPGEFWWARMNISESISIEDAIDAYTINGARAMRHADITGSLEVGKKADFIVINQDVIAAAKTLTTGDKRLDYTPEAYSICDHWWDDHCKTQVERTYLDGELVYQLEQ